MLKFLKKEAGMTYTENNAVTYATTMSDCLDLFASIGALRSASEEDIRLRFIRAYAENPDLAMKILFFARDVRGGLGERRVFRVILEDLAKHSAGSIEKNIEYIPEYGRFDDLLGLLDSPCGAAVLQYIKDQLESDIAALNTDAGSISLLAKWLPSVNASSEQTIKYAKLIAAGLKMSHAEYRKTLVHLRAKIAIIENNLRKADYTFDYEKQPSRALFKYKKAFRRNDGARYTAYISRVSEGTAKMNTGTLYPYDIVAPIIAGKVSEAERKAIDATWKALKDYTQAEDALVVVDGSGSMYCNVKPMPAAIALSLGIYYAERNRGAFRNHFITFSENPRLVEIKGSDILEKVRYCASYNEVANTNIQKVFELILKTAVKNRLKQKDMPGTIYIISDMEFDYCTRDAGITNFEYAKNLFKQHGYSLPKLVYWNVASRHFQQPVTMNEQGVALVSGCSPKLFGMMQSGIISPYAYMMSVLGTERYANITA